METGVDERNMMKKKAEEKENIKNKTKNTKLKCWRMEK